MSPTSDAPRSVPQPSLEARLSRALDARTPHQMPLPPGRPAAVLLLLFERDGEPWMVFTKRTHHVEHHKGEISFPGGARDADDAGPQATAIRETVEELGIDPTDIRVVGHLDEVPTYATGYNVSPFVAVIPEQHAYRPSHHEIDEVIELPVAELARVGRREAIERNGFHFETNVFETLGHYIWGLTGGILRTFLDEVWPALDSETSG